MSPSSRSNGPVAVVVSTTPSAVASKPSKKQKKASKQSAAAAAETTAAAAAADEGSNTNESEVRSPAAKRARKGKNKAIPKDKAERDLELLVFGGEGEGATEDILEKAGRESERIRKRKHSESIKLLKDKTTSTAVSAGGKGNDNDGDYGEDDDDFEAMFMLDATPDESNRLNDDSDDGDDDQKDKDTAGKEMESNKNKKNKKAEAESLQAAAWVDEDDENEDESAVSLTNRNRLRKLRTTVEETHVSAKEYENRLRQQFQSIHQTPKWAEQKKKTTTTSDAAGAGADNDEDEYADDEDYNLSVLSRTYNILDSARSSTLPATEINIARVRNGNQHGYTDGVIQSVDFHPSANVLMTSGLDKTVRLFEIDGKNNDKIQSLFFKDLPVYNAKFTASGSQAIVTGRKRYFYNFDLESGAVDRVAGIRGREENSLEKFAISPDDKHIAFAGMGGSIIIVSRDTKQYIGQLKMNGTVTDVAWSGDGSNLVAIGKDADVYQFDLKMMKCIRKFGDVGSHKPSCIALSNNDKYLACGSYSGIVNTYDGMSALNPHSPVPSEPYKSIYNLTTCVSGIKFNHDSQLMGMFSRQKKDAFKLVHLPTLTVFQNWPTSKTPLSYVNDFAFSPNSGYLAIGNDKGKVLLYRLQHFGQL
ncbi:WD40 repeat-like protein [Ramicandelaber brevisporus]|nr:WD40 repeat-like protein [Ramicandelaber brevisporus]